MLRKLTLAFRKFNLAQQVSLLLSIIFFISILLSGIILYAILNYDAQMEVSGKAGVLLKTMDSVRNYTDSQITPELTTKLDREFLPQIIPSYSAREVFEMLRSDPTWQDYFYKEATLNPTNLRDKADSFETGLIERFRKDSNLQELTGFQTTANEKLFYIAQPTKISQASCLECHSTPDVAPKTMLQRYGSENGFGWQLNSIVGAKMVYIPASQIFQRVYQSFAGFMAVVVVILFGILYFVNFWLHQTVVKPLKRMTKVAEAVSTGDIEVEFDEQKSDNEVGILAQAFTRMKTSLVLAMQRLDRYRNS